jgi:hypothetical protein
MADQFFRVDIRCETSAFDSENGGADEVARLLREAASAVQDGAREGRCRDFNGNKVGRFYFVSEPYCNHDPAAVHNGVCECGERVG